MPPKRNKTLTASQDSQPVNKATKKTFKTVLRRKCSPVRGQGRRKCTEKLATDPKISAKKPVTTRKNRSAAKLATESKTASANKIPTEPKSSFKNLETKPKDASTVNFDKHTEPKDTSTDDFDRRTEPKSTFKNLETEPEDVGTTDFDKRTESISTFENVESEPKDESTFENLVTAIKNNCEKLEPQKPEPKNKCVDSVPSEWVDLEVKVIEWVRENRENGNYIGTAGIRYHAFQEARQRGLVDFLGTSEWLTGFMRRHNLILHKRTNTVENYIVVKDAQSGISRQNHGATDNDNDLVLNDADVEEIRRKANYEDDDFLYYYNDDKNSPLKKQMKERDMEGVEKSNRDERDISEEDGDWEDDIALYETLDSALRQVIEKGMEVNAEKGNRDDVYSLDGDDIEGAKTGTEKFADDPPVRRGLEKELEGNAEKNKNDNVIEGVNTGTEKFADDPPIRRGVDEEMVGDPEKGNKDDVTSLDNSNIEDSLLEQGTEKRTRNISTLDDDNFDIEHSPVRIGVKRAMKETDMEKGNGEDDYALEEANITEISSVISHAKKRTKVVLEVDKRRMREEDAEKAKDNNYLYNDKYDYDLEDANVTEISPIISHAKKRTKVALEVDERRMREEDAERAKDSCRYSQLNAQKNIKESSPCIQVKTKAMLKAFEDSTKDSRLTRRVKSATKTDSSNPCKTKLKKDLSEGKLRSGLKKGMKKGQKGMKGTKDLNNDETTEDSQTIRVKIADKTKASVEIFYKDNNTEDSAETRGVKRVMGEAASYTGNLDKAEGMREDIQETLKTVKSTPSKPMKNLYDLSRSSITQNHLITKTLRVCLHRLKLPQGTQTFSVRMQSQEANEEPPGMQRNSTRMPSEVAKMDPKTHPYSTLKKLEELRKEEVLKMQKKNLYAPLKKWEESRREEVMKMAKKDYGLCNPKGDDCRSENAPKMNKAEWKDLREESLTNSSKKSKLKGLEKEVERWVVDRNSCGYPVSDKMMIDEVRTRAEAQGIVGFAPKSWVYRFKKRNKLLGQERITTTPGKSMDKCGGARFLEKYGLKQNYSPRCTLNPTEVFSGTNASPDKFVNTGAGLRLRSLDKYRKKKGNTISNESNPTDVFSHTSKSQDKSSSEDKFMNRKLRSLDKHRKKYRNRTSNPQNISLDNTDSTFSDVSDFSGFDDTRSSFSGFDDRSEISSETGSFFGFDFDDNDFFGFTENDKGESAIQNECDFSGFEGTRGFSECNGAVSDSEEFYGLWEDSECEGLSDTEDFYGFEDTVKEAPKHRLDYMYDLDSVPYAEVFVNLGERVKVKEVDSFCDIKESQSLPDISRIKSNKRSIPYAKVFVNLGERVRLNEIDNENNGRSSSLPDISKVSVNLGERVKARETDNENNGENQSLPDISRVDNFVEDDDVEIMDTSSDSSSTSDMEEFCGFEDEQMEIDRINFEDDRESDRSFDNDRISVENGWVESDRHRFGRSFDNDRISVENGWVESDRHRFGNNRMENDIVRVENDVALSDNGEFSGFEDDDDVEE